jgi:Protein of unknown function (DUF3710)
VIFSRNRGTAGKRGSHARTRANGNSGADPYGRSRADRQPAVDVPEFGPYDISMAPDPDGRPSLDLGALRIPVLADVEIQLETGPQGEIRLVQLSHGGSRLQLGAFAAPRTEGIWDDVRESLRNALTSGGSKPVEVEGEYGIELQARVRDPKGTVEVRHVGIDGPRWFVHGVFMGAAALDPDRAGPLCDVLRGLVVDRGEEARPVSELLPLRLPPEAASQLADMVEAEATQDQGSDPRQSQAT